MASTRDRGIERHRMVERQIAARGIDDPRVIQAFREVPREAFVPEELARFAYEDSALPIEEGQTISQPYIVALMTSALDPEPGDRALDIGTGSGYAAAILSRLVREVYTVERHPGLARSAEERFARLGYDNVVVRVGDGSLGWSEHAPYDGIVVAAGAPSEPHALREQLAIGGRLVLPIGPSPRIQSLVRVLRESEEEFRREEIGDVRFVPLVGASGWREESDGGGEPESYPFGV